MGGAAVSATAGQQDPPSNGLRVGQAVFQTKFREGMLLTLERADAGGCAQVDFGRYGAKWPALAIAKFTPVD